MQPGTKFGLIIGGSILVLGFAGMIAIVSFTLFGVSSGTERARELFKKRTAETVGTITNVSLSTASKEYTYKYDVNGVTYHGTYQGVRSKVEKDYDKVVGKKITVCYDPSDPTSSDYLPSDVYISKGEKIVCGGTSR